MSAHVIHLQVRSAFPGAGVELVTTRTIDRRDCLTSFTTVGQALSTSYNQTWSLRKKHNLWFAADQDSHPKPVWSLDKGGLDATDSSQDDDTAESSAADQRSGPARGSAAWLLDSSFLVALLDSHDLYSPLCLHAMDAMGSAKKLLSVECVKEATDIIRGGIGGARGAHLELFLYRCIEEGVFVEFYPNTFRELGAFAKVKQEVMETCKQGPTVASIVAMSVQLNTKNVATLDRHNMVALGALRSAAFNLLPL